MSDTIFTPEVTIPSDPTPATVLPQEVIEFVGEGKKYSSVEEALKSVPHAQKHIQTLEQELAQTKEELSKRRATEELLDDIKSGITQAEKPSTFEVSQDKITASIEEVLAKKEAIKKAQGNISSVTATLTKVFGEKAEEKYNLAAQEAGLTVEQLNKLSATSPQAVLKLVGITQEKEPTPTKIQSTVNLSSTSTSSELSARVPRGASTKDMVSAWRAAGEKVKQTQN